MSEFDKWWEENSWDIENYYDAEKAFKAAQQSKQAKIDELQKKYDAMYNAYIFADDCRKECHESHMGVYKERDELQARIDGALLKLTEKKTMYVDIVAETIDILKGNKDES